MSIAEGHEGGRIPPGNNFLMLLSEAGRRQGMFSPSINLGTAVCKASKKADSSISAAKSGKKSGNSSSIHEKSVLAQELATLDIKIAEKKEDLAELLLHHQVRDSGDRTVTALIERLSGCVQEFNREAATFTQLFDTQLSGLDRHTKQREVGLGPAAAGACEAAEQADQKISEVRRLMESYKTFCDGVERSAQDDTLHVDNALTELLNSLEDMTTSLNLESA